MKRAVARLTSPKTFTLFEEDIPALAADEILIKTEYVGLCHSDMPAYLGVGCMGVGKLGYPAMRDDIPYPLVIGHEPTGVVEAVGKGVTRYREGDRVTGLITWAFASHIVTTAGAAMVKRAADDQGICLGEPLMCIANIARIAAPELGDTVAVVGCGFMGLLAIMGLANGNLRELVAIDVLDERLDMARRYGATATINPRSVDVEEEAFRITAGRMFDVVVEITGSLRGFDTAVSIVRLAERMTYKGRGKILTPSLYGRREMWNPTTGYNLMYRAPVIHTAHPMYCLDIQDTMERGMDMYSKGVLRTNELISHRFPITDIAEGFKIMENADPSYIKGIVTFP